jgi:drug/metabolite transporter (DMT)-like permease
MPDPVRSAEPGKTRVVLAFAAVYLVWGSTYLAIRYGIETIPPFFMAGTRFLTAGALLYVWTRARGASRPTLRQWGSATIIGGLMLLFGNGFVSWSELRVPSGIAALIVGCVPMWMVVLERKRPGARTATGLLLGLAGIALLVGPEKFAGGERVDLLGAAMLVFASFSWALGSLYSRSARLPESKPLAMAMEMLAGGALLFVAGLVKGEASGFDVAAVSSRSLLAVAYLVVFGSLIGFTCYVWLLYVTTPARAATYAYVNPVVAVLLGWLFAGEALSGRTLAAATIIIAAVVMILGREGPEPKRERADASLRSRLGESAEPERA